MEVSDALEVEPHDEDEPSSERLLDLRAELHEQGRLDEKELAQARLLHAAVEEADAERRARQAARPADAPRAYRSEGAGALLARMFLQITTALGTASQTDAEGLAEAMRAMREKLEAEDERQVEALRAELADFDFP